MNSPNWRPQWKYYHRGVSFVGVCLAMTLMVMIGWYYALISFAIMILLFMYFEFSFKNYCRIIAHYTNKNWGL